MPALYRKRLIPAEKILLDSDEIILLTKDMIHTRWKPIKPRKDIGSGESWYFIQKGFKISKFFDLNGNFSYWYCDIINTEYDPSKDEYVFTDLLIDVVIYPDGFVKVLDIDEVSIALEKELISISLLKKGLDSLAELLNSAYKNEIEKLIV